MFYLTGAVIKANCSPSNMAPGCHVSTKCTSCARLCTSCADFRPFVSPCMCLCANACTYVARAHLGASRWKCSWGRSKLLVGRALTIIGGRPVKTSPVLRDRAKVLLKRFFWGALNVVKWSPPQLGHSKRPSLTARAKQTPSPLTEPHQFPSNLVGQDSASRVPTTRGLIFP